MNSKEVEVKTYMIYPICGNCSSKLEHFGEIDYTTHIVPMKKYSCPNCGKFYMLSEENWERVCYKEVE